MYFNVLECDVFQFRCYVPANLPRTKFIIENLIFFLKVDVSREIGGLWGHKISMDKFLTKAV